MATPHREPLSATIAERLGLPEKLVAAVEKRPSPPSARAVPLGIAEPPKLHALPPPEGPDRSQVDVSKGQKKPEKRARRWHKIPEKEALAYVCKYRDLLADGVPKRVAAGKLDITPAILTRLSKRKFAVPPELKAKMLAKAAALEAEGYTLQAAADKLAIHPTSISGWRREKNAGGAPRAPVRQKPDKAPAPTKAATAQRAPSLDTDSLESVWGELTQLKARERELKQRLRALLGDG